MFSPFLFHLFHLTLSFLLRPSHPYCSSLPLSFTSAHTCSFSFIFHSTWREKTSDQNWEAERTSWLSVMSTRRLLFFWTYKVCLLSPSFLIDIINWSIYNSTWYWFVGAETSAIDIAVRMLDVLEVHGKLTAPVKAIVLQNLLTNERGLFHLLPPPPSSSLHCPPFSPSLSSASSPLHSPDVNIPLSATVLQHDHFNISNLHRSALRAPYYSKKGNCLRTTCKHCQFGIDVSSSPFRGHHCWSY